MSRVMHNNWRFLKHVLLGIFLLIFTAATAQAAPITLDIVASVDGDIHYLNPNYTVNDSNTSVQMSMSGGNSVKRGFFEFDLSSVPDDITIISASLLIMTSGLISNTGPTADVYLYSYIGDGQITLSDFFTEVVFIGSANYPAGTVGDGGTPRHTVLHNDFSNLDPLITALSQGDDYFGIQVRVPSFVTLNVHSLESTYSAVVFPTLRLNYEPASGPTPDPIPEPGTIALLGIGLAGLGLYGYRRRSRA